MTKTTRKQIGKRLRFNVLKRDNFTCQYCGSQPPNVPLEIDHITPVSKGGKNDITNLITSCFDCNRGKADVQLSDVPSSLVDTIERKKIAQEQYLQYKKILKKERDLMNAQIDIVEKIYNDCFEEYTFKNTFRLSVKQFIQKLGIEEVERAMEIACNKITYHEQEVLTYFCGICWNKIKGNK